MKTKTEDAIQNALDFIDHAVEVYERSTGRDEYRMGALFVLYSVRTILTEDDKP